MKLRSARLLTVLLLAPGSLAEAQFSAQLQGTVLDQTRGVVPRASCSSGSTRSTSSTV